MHPPPAQGQYARDDHSVRAPHVDFSPAHGQDARATHCTPQPHARTYALQFAAARPTALQDMTVDEPKRRWAEVFAEEPPNSHPLLRYRICTLTDEEAI